MSGGFASEQAFANAQNVGADLTNTVGTQIVTGGANTLSGWTQLSASLPSDISSFYVFIQGNYGALFLGAVDIGVGAAGSEKVIVSGLMAISDSNEGNNGYPIPISIPAGSRVAARYQAQASGDKCWVYLLGLDNSFMGREFSGIDTIGYNSGSTTGTTMTSGAANTKGSYTQLIASTPNEYAGFFFTFPTGGNYSQTTMMDIAIGAAGSEQIILPNWYFNMRGSTPAPNALGVIWMEIPKGVRLAARIQSVNSGITLPIVFYGVYE